MSYPTCEHFIIDQKAMLFGDFSAREALRKIVDPCQVRQIGRRIVGFEEAIWVAHRFEILRRGIDAKFRQSQALSYFLIQTKHQVLAASHPEDATWGIGLEPEDRDAANPLLWRGLNLLGFALMVVRDCVR